MTQSESLFETDHIEGKVIYVLGITSLVQFIYPITESGNLFLLLISQAFYTSLIFIGIILVRNNPRLVRLFGVSGVIWFLANVIYSFNQTAIWANLLVYGTYIIFYVTITGVLLRYIFLTQRITRDVIYGAVTVYLLLGGVFVAIYGIIETITFATLGTSAFSGGISPESAVFAWQDFIYFSYVTLTTLGYGDILPVTMLAKVAVTIEAIIGVMYLTIIMARLVSLYSANVNTLTTPDQ